MPEEQVLQLAASAEQFSEHPIARAIVEAARQRGLEIVDPESFSNQPGSGVVAEVAGQTVLVGSESLMHARGTGFQPVQRAQYGIQTRATTGTHVQVDIDDVGRNEAHGDRSLGGEMNTVTT